MAAGGARVSFEYEPAFVRVFVVGRGFADELVGVVVHLGPAVGAVQLVCFGHNNFSERMKEELS
jgi:hypothetical protein